MTIRAVGSASTPSAERSSSRVDDTTNADRFAGMFSTAVNGSRHMEKARPKHDGTSELDKTEGKRESKAESTDAAEEKEEKKTKARVRIHRSSTDGVITSVAALDPELQDKLARVMTRMQEETGKTVTVNETFRTQDRQNVLYAQGRQTPGDVVTWTQNSKHTQGRAVDVVVEGGNAQLYQTLQRIANEEGLHTLGAIDPGHLELTGNGPKLSIDANSLVPTVPADANGQGQSQLPIARLAEVARLAEPAPVARVAQVATLAEVARVAQPGQAAQTTQTGRGVQTPQSAPMSANETIAANIAATRMNAARGGQGESAAFGQGSQKDSGDGKSGSNGYEALAQGIAMRDHSSNHFAVQSAAAVGGSEAAARAEQLMSLMDATPARQLSSLTVSLDNGNGTSDKIQLSMRGSSLDTTIATADNRVAQLLNAKSEELSKALSKDGIELRELRVRAATETNTVTAAATSQHSQSSGDASNQSRFDRGQAWQRQQDQQDQYDRQRSQQQQRGRQQRQWRGGNE
jgi:uncharacterized protein YcbK (DUF882 family)